MFNALRRALETIIAGYLLTWLLVNYPVRVRAAQNSTWTWNLSPSGNDGNGCAHIGFNTKSITNYSLQSSPVLTFVASSPGTNQATGTVTGTTVVITSGYTVNSNDINNSINIPASVNGTSAAIVFGIIAANTATNQWTLDHTTGLTSAALTGTVLGGPCFSIGKVTSYSAIATYGNDGERFYMQAGTYSYNAAQTLACFNTSGTNTFKLIEGYNTTPGDLMAPSSSLTRPVLTFTSATDGMDIGNTAQCGWNIGSLVMDGQSGTALYGINSGVPFDARWLEVRAFKSAAIFSTYTGAGNGGHATYPIHVWGSYIHGNDTGGTSGGQLSIGTMGLALEYSRVDAIGSTTAGQANILINGNANTATTLIHHSIISNTSSGQHGVLTTGASNSVAIYNNDFYNIGGDAIRLPGASTAPMVTSRIQCNIFDTVGTYGINLILNSGVTAPLIQYHPNTFYRVGTNGNNLTVSSTYYDVLLSVDPFLAAASNNFMLNNSSPGGAQLWNACLSKGISLGGSRYTAPGHRSYGAVDPQPSVNGSL